MNSMNNRRTIILGGLMLAAAAFSSVSLSATAQELPDGVAVVNQCIEAMGGGDAFDSIKSSRVVAVAEILGIGELTLELATAGDRMSVVQTVPGMGEIRSGSDGKVVWGMDPMSGDYTLMDDEQSEQIRSQTGIATMILKIKEEIKSAETVEKTDFNDLACYKVKIIDKDDKETLAYFDTTTKLLAGIEQEQDNPMMGPVQVVLKFLDYKEIAPLTMYTRMVIDQSGTEIDLKFKEIEFNKVDDSLFTLPDEVKELVAKQAAEDGDDDADADKKDDDDNS